MEVVSGDNWTTGAISRAKLQSNHYHQHPVFLQARCPSCRPTNNVKALKGKYHIPWTCLPQTHLGVFQLCLWPLIAPGYLEGGLACLSERHSMKGIYLTMTKEYQYGNLVFSNTDLLVGWLEEHLACKIILRQCPQRFFFGGPVQFRLNLD